MSEKIIVTPTMRDVLLEDNRTIHIKSSMNFLLEHNGLRKGCLHMFIGPTHTGKSTMARTLIKDFMTNNPDKKLHIYLSEESKLQFITEMCRIGMPLKDLNAISISSEADCPDLDDPAKAFKFFQDEYKAADPDLILFDNITTSEMYPDKCVDTQKRALKKIKQFAQLRDIPIALMAHTGADANMSVGRLINENDVRGAKSSVNLTEFLYILQQVTVKGVKTSTLRIIKNRSQTADDPFYFLEYSRMGRYYSRDAKVDFNKFKDLFKESDRI